MYTGIETTRVSNSLPNVWWAFPEWVHDYHTYGQVAGISIDGKHVANLFELPLITTTGRDNTGHFRVFAIDFLRLEDKTSVT